MYISHGVSFIPTFLSLIHLFLDPKHFEKGIILNVVGGKGLS